MKMHKKISFFLIIGISTFTINNNVKAMEIEPEEPEDIESFETLKGHTNIVANLAFSPDSKKLFSTSNDNSTDPTTASLLHHNVKNKKIITSSNFKNQITQMVRCNNNMLAIGDVAGNITMFNSKAGRIEKKFSPINNHIKAMAKSKSYLAIGYANGEIIILNYSTGKIITHIKQIINNNARLNLYCLSFSNDGKYLALISINDNRCVDIFDIEKGKCIKQIKNSQGVRSLDFSSKENLLAIGIYGSTKSPDKVKVVAVNFDDNIKIIDDDDNKVINEFTLPAFYSPIVKFSPDGNYLIIAPSYYTKIIYMLDVNSWEVVKNISGKIHTVQTIQISPNQKFIAFGTGTKTNNRNNQDFITIWKNPFANIDNKFVNEGFIPSPTLPRIGSLESLGR